MSLSSYLSFVLACVALVLLPGPNVALIVGNSLAGGPRLGLATILGTASAATIQVGATVLGLALLLASAAPGVRLAAVGSASSISWSSASGRGSRRRWCIVPVLRRAPRDGPWPPV